MGLWVRIQLPRGLRRRSVVDRCLGLRVWIPSRAWMFVLCVLCEGRRQNAEQSGERHKYGWSREYKKKNPARAWMFIFCVVSSSKQFSWSYHRLLQYRIILRYWFRFVIYRLLQYSKLFCLYLNEPQHNNNKQNVRKSGVMWLNWTSCSCTSLFSKNMEFLSSKQTKKEKRGVYHSSGMGLCAVLLCAAERSPGE